MAWFRRRSSTSRATSSDDDSSIDQSSDTSPDCIVEETVGIEVVPVASATALARTERALSLLASQYGHLVDTVTRLEHRVDALAVAVPARTDAASAADLEEVRRDNQKVAAELRRLEVNLAARLEAVRADLDALAGGTPAEIDLRVLTPSDTGWLPARSA